MDFPQHRRSIPFEAMEEDHFPQRPSAIEHWAEFAHRRRQESALIRTVRQRNLTQMIARIEVRIVLQGGMRKIQRHERETLTIARQQMHPRRHVDHKLIMVDGAIKNIDRSDMQRSTDRLAIYKRGVLRAHSTRELCRAWL